jgi:hypothetical protein
VLVPTPPVINDHACGLDVHSKLRAAETRVPVVDCERGRTDLLPKCILPLLPDDLGVPLSVIHK